MRSGGRILPCILDDLPQPGPRIEMIYFCDGEGSGSTGLGEKVILLPGNIHMLWNYDMY